MVVLKDKNVSGIIRNFIAFVVPETDPFHGFYNKY